MINYFQKEVLVLHTVGDLLEQENIKKERELKYSEYKANFFIKVEQIEEKGNVAFRNLTEVFNVITQQEP